MSKPYHVMLVKKSSIMLVNSQLVCLPPVGFLTMNKKPKLLTPDKSKGKCRNLIGTDQQMQRLEETERGKADRTMEVNCYIFS